MVRTIALGSGNKLRVSGSMGALNDLAAALYEAARYNEEQNFKALAEPMHKAASQIHDALSERGFYDKIRKEETA